jgi:hypothetical protein
MVQRGRGSKGIGFYKFWYKSGIKPEEMKKQLWIKFAAGSKVSSIIVPLFSMDAPRCQHCFVVSEHFGTDDLEGASLGLK